MMFKFGLVLCVALVLVGPTEGIRFRGVKRFFKKVENVVKEIVPDEILEPACKVRVVIFMYLIYKRELFERIPRIMKDVCRQC